MSNVYALIITIIYIADILLFVPKYTRCKYDHTPRARKLVWKGVCIGLPYLILLFGTSLKSLEGTVTYVNWILVLAMTFCAFGDIILEIKFIRGGALFFIGHIIYVFALFELNGSISYVSLAVYAVMVGTGTLLTKTKLSKKYRTLLVAYNLAISGSFALAVPLILTGSPALVLLGTGACFLVISDWLLARNKACGSTFSWSLISLLFYFGGQILISTYPFLM